MIPRECKRLAEVDFPIAAVGRYAIAEKGFRQGLPAHIHMWWARRPLASCRAMLLALLLPDPCDEHCPPEFKTGARAALADVQKAGPSDEDLRAALLKFIGDFANWDLAANQRYLIAGRALVHAAHPEEPPLVVDPFAGGGSIPLEALRLGCEAFASDLNPVACLILKVLLEDIPRHGPELADDLRRAGKEIKEAAEKELAEFYPPDPDGARPIAYLWARTVRCEQPNCGAEIPLMRSCWLSKKANRKRALHYRTVHRKGGPPEIELEIFVPEKDSDVQRGTVSRAKATCPACNIALGPERVRAQLSEQRGGADVTFDANGRRIGGARLLAVVKLHEGEQGRNYRLPTDGDYSAVWDAMRRLEEVAAAPIAEGLSAVPDEPLPPVGTLGFRVQRYGMLHWGDLFTARQKLAYSTLCSLISEHAGAGPLAESVRLLLAIAVDKIVDRSNTIVNWGPPVEAPTSAIKVSALQMGWDFAESNLVSPATASFGTSLGNTARNVEGSAIPGTRPGAVQISDAREPGLPSQSAAIWFTDPPYYDSVPYADLSDLFFVWLKRSLATHPLLFDPYDRTNPLTPKSCECVQDPSKLLNGSPKDRVFFESCVREAFIEGGRVLASDGIGCIIFAHKTTEGWEALLTGVLDAGLTIVSSWPIATERESRMRARDSAALATSVHLVCRPRSEDAPVGDWADVLRELPGRVGAWMERLRGEGVRGADVVFACIGPALEIYSRYSKVETAEGREVVLAEYLERVWEVVGRAALAQVLGSEDGAGTLEEDARLTALFLWTLQSTSGNGSDNGKQPEAQVDDAEDDDDEDEDDESTSKRKPKGYTLIYDVVRRFAQPLGIHLDDWEGRVIETKKGVVRLLPVSERAKRLFGEDGAQAAADVLEREPSSQLALFPEMEGAAPKRKRGRQKVVVTASDDAIGSRIQATTLDRVHAAMLLQASGRANALRALLTAEQERGPDFLRLANALSALYPREAEEKRLLDAMLLAMPK